MFDEYPDLSRPLGNGIHTPYGGGGPFLLAPAGCAVADDGFRLDIVRPPAGTATAAYADLEVRLDATYPRGVALAHLRGDRPTATLADLPLTGWQFRLDAGALPPSAPDELRAPMMLAANGLGSARLVCRLTAAAGIVLETLLTDGRTPAPAFATAWITGVSPRVRSVVRFDAARLLTALAPDGGAGEPTTWAALADRITERRGDLPMELTGAAGPDPAFGETLADRLIARFGEFTPDGDGVRLIPPPGDVELFWSLSQPVLARRRLELPFDLLADVRRWAARDGIGSIVRRHTATTPPFGEPPQITVFCTLPAERRGAAALGATLLFPARPPNRPHDVTVAADLRPPGDLVRLPINLVAGEPLDYRYATYCVLEDDQGVRQVTGPWQPATGTPLRLSPESFPVAFATVRADPALLALATVTGECRYTRGEAEHTVPFALGSGRAELALALPGDATDVSVACTATAPGGARIDLPPFAGRQVSLDLTSFPEYGWHEVEISCEFDGAGGWYAIDVRPEDSADDTVLVFTGERPTRTFGWFAASPFAPGFRYRRHHDDPDGVDGSDGGWTLVPYGTGKVTVHTAAPDGRVSEVAVQLGTLNLLEPVVRAGPELPASPVAEPTDLVVFQGPGDRKYYLPRYRLDEQTVSGQRRYRVAMTQQESAWVLTIHLVRGPAAALADAAHDAEELPHDIAVAFSYLPAPPSGARKTLDVREVARTGGVVTVRLDFAGIQERDEVYRALTEPAREATLTVTRTIQVTAPAPAPVQIPTRWPAIAHWTGVNVPRRPPVLTRGPAVAALTAVPLASTQEPNLLGPPVDVAFTEPTLYYPIQPRQPSLLGAVTEAAPATLVNLGVPRLRDGGVLAPIGIRRPIPIETPPIFVPRMPVPVLACTGTQRRGDFVQVNLSVTNFDEYPADYFAAAPDLPPCGANTNASRTWVDIYDATTNLRLYGFCALGDPQNLQSLWFAVQATEPLPASVYVRLIDRRVNMTVSSNIVPTAAAPPPPPPATVPIVRQLPQPVPPETFAFPPNLHGYMFSGIVPGGGTGGYVRHRLQWKNRFHTYLQDASRPQVVHFLPDQFKIARRPALPFTPLITVRVTSRTSTRDAEVVFDYLIAPYTDPERLRDAATRLAADPAFDGTPPQFQPFLTSDVTLTLDRPTAAGHVREERSDAAQLLQGMLKDTIVMSLDDFGRLFDAMHLPTASLFLGEVRIEIPGEDAEIVGFTARLDDLAGEVFACTAAAKAGAFEVTLLNAIESPIRINALSAQVDDVPATIEGLALPVAALEPGREVSMTVRPATPPDGRATPRLRFNLDGVQVLPDPDAVWEAIVNRAAVAFFQMVEVNVVPSVFTPIPNRPDDQIIAVQVAIEGGGTANLTATKLTDQVRVDYPIDDAVLHHRIDTSYRYTITVIRASGPEPAGQPSAPTQNPSLWVTVTK